MKARDIMTRKVYTTSPEASVQEVAQLLGRESISGVPVVDKKGVIVGMITAADIIGKVNREGLRASDIMTHEVIAVEEETRIGEIAMLLIERNIKRVPVMRDGKMVGIICRADIVHTVAQGHVILKHW
jgi:predicted transcriptional regulator